MFKTIVELDPDVIEAVNEISFLYFDFVDQYNHLFVDLRDYPDRLVFELRHPADIMPHIPKSVYDDYIYLINNSDKITVAVSGEGACVLDLNNTEEEYMLDKMQEIGNYMKAYANGLVREAYNLAQEVDEPVIFALINGTAEIINKEDVASYIDQNYAGTIEEWEDVCVNENPTNLSFLYVGERPGELWYHQIDQDTMDYLKTFWQD